MAEAGESWVQGCPQLCSELQASLDHMRHGMGGGGDKGRQGEGKEKKNITLHYSLPENKLGGKTVGST